MHFDGASVGFVDQAVRHRDVLCLAAPKSKHGPARAERTIRHGHVFATAEESASIVLTLDRAIADVNVLRADEMETVVIAVHTVMDMNSREIHITRLNDADRVIGALQ